MVGYFQGNTRLMGKRSAEYAMETDVGFFLIQAVGKYSALASDNG